MCGTARFPFHGIKKSVTWSFHSDSFKSWTALQLEWRTDCQPDRHCLNLSLWHWPPTPRHHTHTHTENQLKRIPCYVNNFLWFHQSISSWEKTTTKPKTHSCYSLLTFKEFNKMIKTEKRKEKQQHIRSPFLSPPLPACARLALSAPHA